MIIERLLGTMLRLGAEWGARGKSYKALTDHLQNGPRAMAGRVAKAADSELNRRQLRHITGIERWGQRRLRILLGEPTVSDEYDGYQPDASLSVADLWDEFTATRQETIRLAESLQSKGIPLSATAPHNDAGEMSVGAWLVYLRQHAGRETLLIR